MSTELVREAWNEVERLRTFIRSVEWSGSWVTGYDGFTTPCCPSCGGLQPGEPVDDEDKDKYGPSDWGHRPECKLVAALAPGSTGSEKKP